MCHLFQAWKVDSLHFGGNPLQLTYSNKKKCDILTKLSTWRKILFNCVCVWALLCVTIVTFELDATVVRSAFPVLCLSRTACRRGTFSHLSCFPYTIDSGTHTHTLPIYRFVAQETISIPKGYLKLTFEHTGPTTFSIPSFSSFFSTKLVKLIYGVTKCMRP